MNPSSLEPRQPDFVEANLRDTLERWRHEILRLREWINNEGRNCPSNSAVDAVLEESRHVAP